jgi:hypothetical protein
MNSLHGKLDFSRTEYDVMVDYLEHDLRFLF